MTRQKSIVIDPEILVGKPVIKGTRLAAEPPLPPIDKKKRRATKAGIRVLVDENLGKLFEADVNQRFGGNASRCMDAILWNYYGKPPLSFEAPKETHKESDAWSVLHSTPESTYDD
jgi:Protein of unknown function (DUF433)